MKKMPPGTKLNLIHKGQLTVCQGMARSPFFVQKSGAVLEKGFDVDMLHLVADRLGVKPQISSYPSDQLSHLKDLMGGRLFQDGVCDVAAGIAIDTPKSFPGVAFSQPFFPGSEAILEKKGAHYTSLDKLAGKRVGAIDSGGPDELDAYNGKHDPDIKVTRLADPQMMYAQLKAGQLDAVVIGRAQAMHTASTHRAWDLEVGGIFGAKWRDVFAVKKGNTALLTQINAALADAGSNGQYADSYRTWFGTEPDSVPTMP